MVQPTADIRATRLHLRRLRRSIPRAARLAAERAILRHLWQLGVFRPGARVAIYLSMPGEASLAAGLDAAVRAGVRLYAPRITRPRRLEMIFLPYAPGAGTSSNMLGIAEPCAGASRRLRVAEFDTIVVPLLGFDRRGVRLGMGAGYYDRALRRRLDPSRAWRRPRLIGVAYACQELPSIDAAPWDVPLDCVVTECEIVRCAPVPLPSTASAT
jgi:5-formyltetrahydrofolate cyclo-ligase